jgi:hypothetical protein
MKSGIVENRLIIDSREIKGKKQEKRSLIFENTYFKIKREVGNSSSPPLKMGSCEEIALGRHPGENRGPGYL